MSRCSGCETGHPSPPFPLSSVTAFGPRFAPVRGPGFGTARPRRPGTSCLVLRASLAGSARRNTVLVLNRSSPISPRTRSSLAEWVAPCDSPESYPPFLPRGLAQFRRGGGWLTRLGD